MAGGEAANAVQFQHRKLRGVSIRAAVLVQASPLHAISGLVHDGAQLALHLRQGRRRLIAAGAQIHHQLCIRGGGRLGRTHGHTTKDEAQRCQ